MAFKIEEKEEIMLSMKKQVAILAIVPLFLASYIFMALTPMALAIHTSQVQWEACSQKPFVKGPDGIHMWSQAWLGSVANPEHVNFTVTNVKGSPDRITKVEVFFDMNETAPSVGFCYFHFVGGSVHDETGGPARNWTVSVLEIDPRGWPRVLIFETPNAQNGIFDDRTFTFKLDLAEGPSQCDYDFIIDYDDATMYFITTESWNTLNGNFEMFFEVTTADNITINSIKAGRILIPGRFLGTDYTFSSLQTLATV